MGKKVQFRGKNYKYVKIKLLFFLFYVHKIFVDIMAKDCVLAPCGECYSQHDLYCICCGCYMLLNFVHCVHSPGQQGLITTEIYAVF